MVSKVSMGYMPIRCAKEMSETECTLDSIKVVTKNVR